MTLGVQHVLVVCCLGLAGLAEAYVQPRRYLIISSPTTHNVYYATLPTLHELSFPRQQRSVIQAEVLIDGTQSRCSGSYCYEDSDRGLRSPHGVALKQGCGSAVLYVSDVEAQDIFAYELTESPMGGLQVGSQRRVRQGVAGDAEWLAVDSLGNLFLTSPGSGQVQTIPARSLFSSENLTEPATVLFSADASPAVAAPAGVAVDGFFVYWANQNGGGDAGPIARGPERAAAAEQHPPKVVANGGGAYEAMASNVCLARDNAFFTGGTGSVFATKTFLDGSGDGSNMMEVASGLAEPRGCAYDGESTLYVADGGDNAVYSLPANMVRLRAVRHPIRAISVEKPNQLAVFAGATKSHCPHQPMPSRASAAGRFAAAIVAVLVAAA
mmetsp:Transcript_110442/g.323094  ORF Transcript_110442/g.323094 Transcript_110442/m.323094 type:complete len:383 (-) Transcript_110442:68-1216(-)